MLIVILGIIMMATGTAMKYPSLVPFLDPFQARLVHRAISTYFSLVFAVMMATGLVMYLTPLLRKRQPQEPR